MIEICKCTRNSFEGLCQTKRPMARTSKSTAQSAGWGAIGVRTADVGEDLTSNGVRVWSHTAGQGCSSSEHGLLQLAVHQSQNCYCLLSPEPNQASFSLNYTCSCHLFTDELGTWAKSEQGDFLCPLMRIPYDSKRQSRLTISSFSSKVLNGGPQGYWKVH